MLLTCTNGLVKSNIVMKYITTTPNNILSMRHSNSVAKSNFPPLIISIVASCCESCDVRLGRILVPCVRLPRISANLGQLRVVDILLCMRLSGRLPTKEVVAHTVAACKVGFHDDVQCTTAVLHACIINSLVLTSMRESRTYRVQTRTQSRYVYE